MCEGELLLNAFRATDMAAFSERASVARIDIVSFFRIREAADGARLDALCSFSDALVLLLKVVELLAHVGVLPREILDSSFQLFQAVQIFALTSAAGA